MYLITVTSHTTAAELCAAVGAPAGLVGYRLMVGRLRIQTYSRVRRQQPVGRLDPGSQPTASDRAPTWRGCAEITFTEAVERAGIMKRKHVVTYNMTKYLPLSCT